jgi:hypothetical protein
MPDHLFIRRFLNRPSHHRGAYIVARVPYMGPCRDKHCSHLFCADVVFDIADCSRVVHLEFDLDTASQRRNALAKANTLVEVTTRFRDALEVAVAQVAADRAFGSRRGR